jgi:hypothetical protein
MLCNVIILTVFIKVNTISLLIIRDFITWKVKWQTRKQDFQNKQIEQSEIIVFFLFPEIFKITKSAILKK